MINTYLTEEEKEKLITALNNAVEPSPDLLLKLFPATSLSPNHHI